jgi:hypothetical protein
MHLEDDLKRALRPESPAPGFANRVLQRIEREQTYRPRPAWWRAAAASLTLAALLGGYAVHRQREGERAKDELLRAMSITSEKIHYAQQEVRSIGSPD